MSDPLSSAARLINGGCPLEVFVGALSEASQRALWLRCAKAVEDGIDARQHAAPTVKGTCSKCGEERRNSAPNGEDHCCCIQCHARASDKGRTVTGGYCVDCPHLPRLP